jgi:hypothetical protein
MAGIDDLFAEFLGGPSAVDVNQARVAAATTERNANIRGGYIDAAEDDVGILNDSISEDWILDSGTPEEVAARSTGRSQYAADASGMQDTNASVGDSVVDLVNGAFQGALGIGAAGAGLIDKDAGTAVAGFANDANAWTQDNLQSDALAGRRRANAARDQVTEARNLDLSRQESARGDSDFMVGLRRIGRDFVDGITNTDGSTRLSGVSQGLGSLLAGGALGKVAKLAGAGRASMPLAIAALEGGGAYQQTVAEVMGMSHDQLLTGSPEYAELVGSGVTPDAAKRELANRAGLIASAIQAPIGLATGALVSKFEASPLKVPSVRTGLGNIVREGVEEGIQSGTGALSSNVGISQTADENQDMLEGIGSQAGTGAVFGMGTAGAVQAPGIAGRATVAAVAAAGRTAGNAIRKGVENVNARVEQVLNRTAEEAPLSGGAIDEAATTVAASATSPEFRASVDEALQSVPEAQRAPAQEYVERVLSRIGIDAEAEAAEQSSPVLQEAIAGATDRFDAMRKVAAVAGDVGSDPIDRLQAGLYILKNLQENDDLYSRSLPEAIEAVDDNDPALGQLRQFEDVVYTIVHHPEVKKAISGAVKYAAQLEVDKVTQDPRALDAAAAIAELMPEHAKLDVTQAVLKHKSNLTDDQRQRLQATADMLTIAQEHQAELEKLGERGNRKGANIVHNEVLLDPLDKTSQVQSGAGHFSGVMEALRNRNTELAKSRLKRFMDFAQHMANKLEAYNESYRNGGASSQNTTKFQGLTKAGKFMLVQDGVWLNPARPQSVTQAKLVESEARALIALANRVAGLNPDLGVKPIADVRLDDALQGDVREVAYRHREQARAAQATKPATPEPAETGQPEGGDKSVEVQEAAPVEQEAEAPAKSVPEPKAKVEVEVEPKAQPKTEAPSEAEPEAATKPAAASEASEAKAKVEPEALVEEEETKEKAPPTSVAEAWPNLLEVGTNWFHKAFRLPKAPISRIIGDENPIATVREGIQQGKAPPAVIKTYVALINSLGRDSYLSMQGMLDKLLDSPFGAKTAKTTFRDVLLNGAGEGKAPITTNARARILNLVRDDGTGKLKFDDNLLSSAILAGINWALNQGQQGQSYSDEQIAKILGIPETGVRSADRDFFNTTIYNVNAVDGLTRMIIRYWGVQADPNVEMGHTIGIPQAMAQNILESFKDAGLINFVDHEANKKTFVGLQVTFPKVVLDNLSGAPDLIEQLVAVEPEVVDHVGTPPKAPTSQRLGGKVRALPKQQQEAAKRESETPHRFTMPMFNLISGLGPDLAVRLFGHSNLENPKLNAVHKKSMEGFNRTITGAYAYAQRLAEQARNWAAANDKSLEEAEIFFNYEFSAVNRMHMQGSYNPQANKLMREMLGPNQAELDLTNANHRDGFMLAVAQHWGVKVHRIGVKASVAEAKNLANTKYTKSIELLQDWAKRSTGKNAQALTEGDIEVLLSEFGTKPAPGAIHAALEYARMLNAQAKNETKLTTSTYLEADGVTDGPVNALMHLVSGGFTPHWLAMMAKGGLFIGSKFKSFADYANSDSVFSDLYEVANQAFTKALAQDRELRDGNEKVGQQRRSLLFALDRLLPKEVSFDVQQDLEELNSSLQFDRSVAKNPMTVTVYGAGLDGIANKLANSLISKVYEAMSSGTVDPALVGVLNNLINRKAVIGSKGDNKGKMFIIDAPAKGSTLTQGNFVEFQFSKEQFENLALNIKNLFVQSLSAGIEATVGETNAPRRALQAAIQVQGLVVKEAFRNKIQAALQAKKAADPTWSTQQFLSQAELDGIRDEVFTQHHMLVETGTQTFLPAASDNADISDPNSESERESSISLSRSIRETLRTPLMVEGPDDPGVKGIPYMVIGPGDGQMVQNAITSPDRPTGALYVFDGVNLKLTTAVEDSRVINQAVYDGWLQGNPLQSVADSFNKFLDNLDEAALAEMSEETMEALERALSPYATTEESLDQGMKSLGEVLSEHALINQARKNVLSRVNMSVDHMASAEAPHSITDQLEISGTFEEQASQLNDLLQAEYDKLSPAQVEEAAVDPEDETSGLHIRPVSDLARELRQMKVPSDQLALLKDTLAAAADFTVFTGSRQDIERWLKKHQPLEADGVRDELLHGFVLPDVKQIFLLDFTPETAVHELVHAATYTLIRAHYTGGKITPLQTEAVLRLEKLMEEFMQLREPTEAYVDAFETIEEHLQKGEMHKAVNEFMAWVLANPELRELAGKTKVKSPLARLALDAYQTLKRLLFGTNVPKVADDILSNLEFNTRVLARTQPTAQEIVGETLYHQSRSFGDDVHLQALRKGFDAKIVHWINSKPALEGAKAQADFDLALSLADDVRLGFEGKGFNMSQLERSTFNILVAAFATEMSLDPNVLSRIEQIYSEVTKKLKVEDFMTVGDGADPTLQDRDRYYAEQKLNAILGVGTSRIDAQDRSTLMSGFLALAMVNSQFRGVLSQVPVPKAEKSSERTLDARLMNMGVAGMDNLARMLSGEGRNQPHVKAALDQLTNRLVANALEDENFIQQQVTRAGNAFDKMNDRLVDVTQQLSGELFDRAGEVAKTTDSKAMKAGAKVAQLMASVVNEKRGALLAEGVMAALNRSKVPDALHSLFNEVLGRTESNGQIIDMIKLVRSMVQRDRQQFREHLPEQIAKQFTRPLEDSEWTSMTTGLAKTDIAALAKHFRPNEILGLLKDSTKVASEISRLEEELQGVDGSQFPLWQKKAQELAQYMHDGTTPANLLRNAWSVAHLYDELPVNIRKKVKAPASRTIELIDQLVTLYALDKIEEGTRGQLKELAETEVEGMEFVLSYLIGRRTDEQLKVQGSVPATINAFKGHVLSESKTGASLVVASDDSQEYVRLRQLGYVRVADYNGSRSERGSTKKGYYYSPVSGRAMYNQGILQNIRMTAGGVDPRTGFAVGIPMAGQVTDASQVSRAKAALRQNGNNTEGLLPVRDSNGDIVAFERAMDPTQVERLSRNTHMGEILGMWTGRQIEEIKAQSFNRVLISNLAEIWDSTTTNDKDQFVNLFSQEALKDPVYRDAVKLFTPEARRTIRDYFGDGEFWVRKDMIYDAVGYRAASVGDSWTGVSRLPSEARKQIRNVAIAIFGIDAYKKLVKAEQVYETFVTDARMTIVVKSVIVPMANIMSNMVHLMARGVPITHIAKGMTKKASETDAYIKGTLRRMELEGLLQAARGRGDTSTARALKAELRSIHDAERRLSIWPLIQAGEFASISDVGVSREEILLSEGRLSAYMETLTSKLPKEMQTLGRYAIVSKDTALYKGLQRAVTYGDFLAKAVLFDELTKRKGKTPAEALARITEEFINYDRLPGRTRGKLEHMGLMWFWHFKLRSLKVALSVARNNPLHMFMAHLVPTPDLLGSVGTPVTDNILSVTVDNRLPYSLGVGQLVQAHSMNPWFNLWN